MSMLATLALTAVGFVGPGDGKENPVELGLVRWEKDHDAAVSRAGREGKPVFLLFQEVPGCHGCRVFGQEPLSHPLVVEAIETEFVPASVNNRANTSYDAKLVSKYGEPKLNYPVIRFLDSETKDIIPRMDEVWATGDVTRRMIEALEAHKRPVPGYLELLAQEHANPAALRKATFAMHCYWDGEASLGGIDGVTATRSGWIGGKEVVEVTYDPAIVTYGALVQTAQARECASTVFAHDDTQFSEAKKLVGDRATRLGVPARDAKASDQHFALGRTPFRFVPMTGIQKSRVNSALRLNTNPLQYLSPRQRALATRLSRADDAALAGLEELTPDDVSGWGAYLEEVERRLGS